MRTSRFAFSLAALLICAAAFAQHKSTDQLPTYYLYHGQRTYLELDPSSIAVRVSDGMTGADLMAGAVREGVRAVDPLVISGWYFIRLATQRESPLDVSESILRLLNLPGVEFASPVFRGAGDDWMVIGSDILARFRSPYAEMGGSLLSTLAPELRIVTGEFGKMRGAFALRSSARNGFEVLARANSLAEDPRVEWAEPDAIFTGRGAHIPNDPGFIWLWGIRNTGQTGGVADMDMDGDLAWNHTTGDGSVKIAVIDVGVQLDHPDLHVLPGADMTGAGGSGGPGNACDWHGTAVAGCITAEIDNDTGTVGIAPDCYVLSVRTFVSNSTIPCSGSWTTTQSWTVNALAWAESVGCKVTNNSNAYGFTLAAIEAKYQATHDSGMVHFASSGNDTDLAVSYPASIPVVNSVGALNDSGRRAIFSNYGSGLDFSAPGVDIYTTDRTGAAGYVNGDYTFQDGTSFASPYAAGVAALVFSRFSWLTPAQVESRMRRACKDLGPSGYDTEYGWGFVNAHRALTTAVTFRVDMRVKMRDGTFRRDLGDQVTVQGSFNLWTNVDTLQDQDNDSVYVKPVSLSPFLGYVYRFWKTPRSGMGLENSDRVLSVDEPDTLLAAPYFNNDGPPVLPTFAVAPTVVNFGSVPVGNSKQDSVTVTNSGPGTLTIDSVRSDNAEFTVTPTSGVIVPPGILKFFITFQPASTGAKNGNIVFYHDADSSPDTVTVGGNGTTAGPMLFLSFPPETLAVSEPAKPDKFIKPVRRHRGLYPNWANLRDELVAQGGFAPGRSESDSAGGMRIGVSFMERRNPGDPAKPNWKPRKDSAKVYCWVRIGKYNFKKSVGASPTAIPKTLRSKGSLFHAGVPRGLDSTGSPGAVKRKLLTKEIKKLEPKKTSNPLFAELLALKFGIAASALGKSPPGLGELVFERDGNLLDERTVKQISARADSMMTFWRGHTRTEYDSVLSTIRDINRAFAGRLDTVTWERPLPGFPEGNLTVEGQVDVHTVPFLRVPSPFLPERWEPTAYVTEAEEEFGEEDFDEGDGQVPAAMMLYQNFPNPFNPTTTISFRLREASAVTLRVYTMLGQEVAVLMADEELEEGYQTVAFEAGDLASGVYFYRVDVRALDEPSLRTVETGKMLLVK